MPSGEYEAALERVGYEQALASEQRALEAQMLAEQVGGITAGGGGRSYPDLVGGKVRLQTPEYDYGDLALRAAQAGALGGAVGAAGGSVSRAGLPYEDWLRGIEEQPLVFRGLSSEVDDPLGARPGYAAFGSNNPATALSYAGDPRIRAERGGPSTGSGAAVHPIRLSPAEHRGSLRDYS